MCFVSKVKLLWPSRQCHASWASEEQTPRADCQGTCPGVLGTYEDWDAPGAVGPAALLTSCSLSLFCCLSANQCQPPSFLQHLPPSLLKIWFASMCAHSFLIVLGTLFCCCLTLQFKPSGLKFCQSGASYYLCNGCCHCLALTVCIWVTITSYKVICCFILWLAHSGDLCWQNPCASSASTCCCNEAFYAVL